jgi:dynein heavy chain
LVGKEPKDYRRLGEMQKEFKPFSDLWLNTKTWFSRHEAWTTGPWEEIDPEELDQTFENVQKSIAGATKYFKNRDFPKILANAQTMKEKVDAFKPVVPLALSLRKKGMVDRHWDQISNTVGFDIRPVEGFTLTMVCDKGMLNHVELAEEVGEKAYKEFNIETSLRKMQADWEGIEFTLPQFK